MLDQLVNTQKENNKRLAAIERSVNNLVKVNTATAKREKEAANKAARMGRREKALAGGSERQQAIKEMMTQKKQSKSFMENLLGFLKNPIAIVAIGGLVIAGFVKALQNEKVKKALGALFDIIKVKLKEAWDFVLPKIKEGMAFLKPYFEEAAQAAGNVLKDMIKNAFKEAMNFARNFISDPLMGNDRNRGAERAASAGGPEAERIKKTNKLIQEKLNLEKEMYRRERAARQFRESGRSQKDIDKELEAVEIKRAKINALIEEIKLEEKLYRDKNIYREQDFRMRQSGEMQRGVLNARDWTTGDVTQKLQEAFNAFKGALGFQKGGPLTVPGSGSGDKVFTFLQPGSFVMNRNASKVGGFQMGGVPVMLEPGEHVYGPGQWDAGHLMLNSMLPRFQDGGKVDVKQSKGVYQTGPGYQPDSLKDYKGRPIIVSKEAAIAIMKMYKDGLFKGSDVTSAQRSPAHNAAVGGVANSKHLAGNALDVSTGTSTWHALKNSGPKYGWKFNNYLGPQGWHFDFVGGGGGAPADGKEQGSAKDVAKHGNLASDLATTGELAGQGAEEIVNAAGKVMGAGMKPFLDGIRKMGLPGLADTLEIFGSGMKAVFGPAVNFIAQGIGNFASGFVGSIFGGNQAQAGTTPNTGAHNRTSELGRALGIKPSGQKPGGSLGPQSTTPLSGGSGKLNLSDAQYRELAFIVSGESAPGEDDFGVAAAVLNRVADPRFPNTIRAVGRQPGQFEAVEHGSARYDDTLAQRLKSNSSKIVGALEKLQGRTDFKGQALLHNRGKGDPMFSSNGNFYHYAEQGHSSTAPAPSNSPQHWKKLLSRQQGGVVVPGMATGGVVNMNRAPQPMMKRLSENMGKYSAMKAQSAQPIIIPVPMGGGGGGGTVMSGSSGTPEAPGLPDGPQVVALLELQNRLALGAMI
jgi:hypothetical protein